MLATGGSPQASSRELATGGSPRPSALLTVRMAALLTAAAVIMAVLAFGGMREATELRCLERDSRGACEPHAGSVRPISAGNDAALTGALGGRRSVQAQLQRLRAQLDDEAARPLIPVNWRKISYQHWYWAAVSVGAKLNQGPPVALQLKLHAALPSPAATRVAALPERSGAFYQPSAWHEPVSALTGAAELNATLVAGQPGKRLMLAADVWFVDGCVHLISTPECEWALDWRKMTIGIHGAWARDACAAAAADGALTCPDAARSPLRFDGPLPPSRVRIRTTGEWSVNVELCSAHLVGAEVLDVEFYAWGISKRWLLPRVDAARRPSEELAMMTHFKNASAMLPLWLQSWRALGVGRFYLYVNGRVSDLLAEDVRIAAQLAADPGVTLVEWDMPFMQANGVDIIAGKCSGHYSQIMAFNHAYERIRRRHLYMGFHDSDEYGLLDESLLQPAWDAGDNPLLQLFGRYGFPAALQLPNRFGAVVPPLPTGVLAPTSALARSWYGLEAVDPVRGKSWVRTMDMADDINLGNHDVFEMVQRSEDPRTGTVLTSGSGFENRYLKLATPTLETDASMLHILNFRPHHSKLPIDEQEAMTSMTSRDVQRKDARAVFERAQQACLACAPGEPVAPGCGYDC